MHAPQKGLFHAFAEAVAAYDAASHDSVARSA
jgi:hypothetical protein